LKYVLGHRSLRAAQCRAGRAGALTAHRRFDLLKWLVPLMFGQVLAIAAPVKLL